MTEWDQVLLMVLRSTTCVTERVLIHPTSLLTPQCSYMRDTKAAENDNRVLNRDTWLSISTDSQHGLVQQSVGCMGIVSEKPI